MTAASDRVERLARVLCDHECWDEVLLPGGKTPRNKREFIGIVLDDDPPVNSGLGFQARAVVRAAIREVESGAIFGSETRCCVCAAGGPGIERDGSEGNWGRTYWHVPGCRNLLVKAFGEIQWNPQEDRTERGVIRARALHREAKPDRLCANCADLTCSKGMRTGEKAGGCPCYREVKPKPGPACDDCAHNRPVRIDGMCATCFERSNWRPRSKPAPNPVREWGMAWPGKAGVLGSPHEYQPETLRRWRDRLRAGKIRAEVPPQPSEEMVERVTTLLLHLPINERAAREAARAAIRKVLR